MARKHNEFTKAQILEAIKGSYGIVSNVAKLLGCEWHTAEKAVNSCGETKQAYLNERERLLDFVEGKGIAAIKKGDGAMIRYYLSTIGKKRGYTENNEETKQGNAGAKIELVLIDKPPEGTK